MKPFNLLPFYTNMRLYSCLFLNIVLYITSACDFACLTDCEKIEELVQCRISCGCAKEKSNGDTLDYQEVYEDNLKLNLNSVEQCSYICNQHFTGDKALECSSYCYKKSYLINLQVNSDTRNNIDDTLCISECTDLCNQQPQDQVTKCLEKCLAEKCKINYPGNSKFTKDKLSVSAVCGVAVAIGAISWAIGMRYKKGCNKLKEPLLSI